MSHMFCADTPQFVADRGPIYKKIDKLKWLIQNTRYDRSRVLGISEYSFWYIYLLNPLLLDLCYDYPKRYRVK